MAIDSYDPVTGSPIFLDTGAPDIGVDPTEAAKFAAQVGTRLIGPTVDREAYAYARAGLLWQDTSRDQEYMHNGAEWIPSTRTAAFTFSISGFTDSTLASSTIPTAVDAGLTTDDSFITARTGTTLTVTAGLYLVTLHFEVAPPNSFTGRSFAEVAVAGAVIARGNADSGMGENATSVTSLAPVATAGTQIAGRIYKRSGGNVNVSGRLIIAKLN